MPYGGGAGEQFPTLHNATIRTAHVPDRDSAASGLPNDIGVTVAVKVGGAHHAPDRRIASQGFTAQYGTAISPAHIPDHDGAVGRLPDNVRFAVAIEVTDGGDTPDRR